MQKLLSEKYYSRQVGDCSASCSRFRTERYDCSSGRQSRGLTQFFALLGFAGEAFVADGIVFVLDRCRNVEE